MLTKEEGKKNLQGVIDRFKRWEIEGRLNNEDDVKTLIEELFEKVLGWDKDDIYRERHPGPTSKRADFQFKDKGVTKLILETKAFGVSWDKNTLRQAVGYGWSANKEYVILTNFQSMILFNAKWKDEDKQIFEIENIEYCLKFSDKFDLLWKLSKESFSTGEIDRFSEDTGKKMKKLPISTIDKQLLKDLKKWREILTRDIKILNNLPEDEVDEVVQRIINRLIFIRVCEDRGLEPGFSELRSHLRIWSEKKAKRLIDQLLFVFHHYDNVYDGTIFQKNDLCENVEIHDNVLEKVIEELYIAKDVNVEYNFASIDADVLGSVYEEYLGYLLKGKKITENHAHRKEQGIYYTPTYIVDYIVRNTLSEILKQNKEIDKIKILDPACGSGSFLIKAFDVISDFWKEKIGEEKFNRQIKNTILTNNLYGVDLDPQAVEIAQLNLLLKIGEKGELPRLKENIKCGNSLIDDPAIAGEDKAFKWEEKFPETIQYDENGNLKEGYGFDVVIGNPPYIMVENLQKNEREYMMSHFETALKRFDIYIGFIERALKLLKKGGVVGFIIPYQFLTQDYAEKMRGYILEECTIRQIVDLSQQKVFQAATVRNIILIVEKGRRNIRTKIVHSIQPNVYTSFDVSQKLFEMVPEKKFRTNINESNVKILDKILSKSINLGKIALASWGARGVPKEEFQLNTSINELCKKMIKGKNLSRYNIKYSGKWFLYDIRKLYRPAFPELFENEKLVFRGIVDKRGMVVSYDDNKYYTDHSLNCLILKYTLKDKEPSFFGQRKITITEENINLSRQFNLKFLLGIINSKLVNFYFKLYFSDELHVYPEMIEQLPIPNIPETKQQPIINLVDKMLSLNKRLNELGDKKTDAWARLKEEKEKTDKEIDELVYKIYDITEAKKKIIEESLER